MRVVRVSGTIRKAEEEAMRRARESMRRAVGQQSGEKMTGLSALLNGHAGHLVEDLKSEGDDRDAEMEGSPDDEEEEEEDPETGSDEDVESRVHKGKI